MNSNLEVLNVEPFPPMLSFHHANKDGDQEVIGELWFDKDDMILKFKGNVDEAGKMLVDFVIESFNEHIQKALEEITA